MHQPLRLLAILLFVGNALTAQTIEVGRDGVLINSQRLTKTTTAKEIQQILGKADRSSAMESTILTYDALGLRIYLDPSTQIVTSVELDLVKGEFKFSPKKIFHGSFSINGRKIDQTYTAAALTQIKEINFHHRVLDLYTGTIAGATLTFTISDETHKLDEIAVTYNSDQ
jgi:hypothetical protein